MSGPFSETTNSYPLFCFIFFFLWMVVLSVEFLWESFCGRWGDMSEEGGVSPPTPGEGARPPPNAHIEPWGRGQGVGTRLPLSTLALTARAAMSSAVFCLAPTLRNAGPFPIKPVRWERLPVQCAPLRISLPSTRPPCHHLHLNE